MKSIKKKVLAYYLKYIGGMPKSVLRVLALFDQIPSFLSKHEKRVIFPNVGLSLNEDRTYVKCYMGDTGLLLSHTFNENDQEKDELYRMLLLGRLSVNEGMFFENAVAQELVSKGHKFILRILR